MEEEAHRKSRGNRTTKSEYLQLKVTEYMIDAQSERVKRYGVKVHPTFRFLDYSKQTEQGVVLYTVKNL